MSCDIAIMYFWTVISVAVNHLKIAIMNGALISINFTTVASKVVASLMSRYEKAHPHEKRRIVVIFLCFCGLLLTNYD